MCGLLLQMSASVTVSVCLPVCVCLHCKRKTAWAINTKLGTLQSLGIHWSRGQKVNVTWLSDALPGWECMSVELLRFSSYNLVFMLWCCWLGSRKGIRLVKNWVVGCWHGYLSEARCRLTYGPADSTTTYCFSSKSRLVLHFWYWLTWVVPDKELLNGCCSSNLICVLTAIFEWPVKQLNCCGCKFMNNVYVYRYSVCVSCTVFLYKAFSRTTVNILTHFL